MKGLPLIPLFFVVFFSAIALVVLVSSILASNFVIPLDLTSADETSTPEANR